MRFSSHFYIDINWKKNDKSKYSRLSSLPTHELFYGKQRARAAPAHETKCV